VTYLGVFVESRAKSRFENKVDLQSRHIRTSTLISEDGCFSDCALLAGSREEVPPETLRPTFVEQFVAGLLHTMRPHNRQ